MTARLAGWCAAWLMLVALPVHAAETVILSEQSTNSTEVIRGLVYSKDGCSLFALSDKFIEGWDLSSGKPGEKLGDAIRPTNLSGIALSSDGSLLAAGAADKTVRVWRRKGPGWEALSPLKGHGKGVWSVAFAPEGKLLATGGDDMSVRLFDLDKPDDSPVVFKAEKVRLNGVRSVGFTAGGKGLVLACRGQIQLWNLEARPPRMTAGVSFGNKVRVPLLAVSPDGRALAAVSGNDVFIHDITASGIKERRALKGHSRQVESVAFSADGKVLATAGGDGRVILWNPATGGRFLTLMRPGEFTAVTFAPGGGDVRLAAANKRKQLLTLSLRLGDETVSTVAKAPADKPIKPKPDLKPRDPKIRPEPRPTPEAGISESELAALMKSEPISLANWPAWRERLKKLTGSDPEMKGSVFKSARGFAAAEFQRGGRMPAALDKDAFAWLLLGQNLYFGSIGQRGTRRQAEDAEKALRHCVKLDTFSAQGHAYLGLAIRRLELPPAHVHENVKPNPGRLREARDHLGQAKFWGKGLTVLPAVEEAKMAAWSGDWGDAEQILKDVLQSEPGNQDAARQYARAVVSNKMHFFGRAQDVATVANRFPDDGTLVALHGVALGLEGDAKSAVDRFKRARELGTDPAKVVHPDTIRSIEEKAKAAGAGWFGGGLNRSGGSGCWGLLGITFVVCLVFTVFYAGMMMLMALSGLILAQFTRGPKALDLLGAADTGDMVAQGQVARTRHESWLTRFYCVMLVMALVMFYLAVPFVIWGLVFVLLFVVLLTFFIRRDADMARIHNDLLLASTGSMTAVFKALFARFASGSFGVLKDEDDCPRLYEALREVARRVDTEPVDEVYVAPGSTIGVHQEGRGPFGLFGSKKRVLTLGLSTMHFLTVSELKAILAHEYAHFSHKDTFYSRFIYQVSLSIQEALRGMASTGGWVTWVNPFFWFFYLYHKSYSLLSSGFSRSREFLADRMACSLYGANVFTSALTKVCTDGTLFELTIYTNIQLQLDRDKAFINMYHAFRKFRDEVLTGPERKKLYKKLLKEEASLLASHPTFGERIEAVKSLPHAEKTEDMPALHLFEDHEEIERELTDFLTDAMARRARRRR